MNYCFVCIGNSCRSIMAEAYANSRFPQHNFYSAGVCPTWEISEMSFAVCSEEGYEIKKNRPQGIDEIKESIDLYIVLDNEIELDVEDYIKKPVMDPYGYDLSVFRRVFSEIKRIVDGVVSDY